MERKSTSTFFTRTLSSYVPKRITLAAAILTVSVLFVLAASSAPQPANSNVNAGQTQAAADWKPVEQALGKAGSMQPGDVYKVSLPRSDLKVTVGGVELKPALALGSWIAFKKSGSDSMVMGDLVLTEDEVTPVLTKLQEGGVEVSALHNHVLHESPRVMYMHIHAMGDATKIAKAIHDALALSKTPFTAPPAPVQTPDVGIDTKQIDQIMGQTGKANGVVYQYGIARADDVSDSSMNGFVIPPSMGVAQAINFQATGGGKAAITGDFVMVASEVDPVIKALRENGIEVTALHSHMLTDSPHLFFMHFWANDDALKLAKGLRTALDRINVKHV
jgi:uncharacterized protein DUF1259